MGFTLLGQPMSPAIFSVLVSRIIMTPQFEIPTTGSQAPEVQKWNPNAMRFLKSTSILNLLTSLFYRPSHYCHLCFEE